MNLFTFNKHKTNLMISKEINKNLIKFILSNKYSNLKSNKILKMAYKNKYFYKYSSTSFFRKACILSGQCNAVSKLFKLTRYLCKKYASNGLLVGIRKASF